MANPAPAQTQPAHSKSWSPPRRATDVDAHISKRLRAARNLAGMSQTAAGEHIGVTFQQLQKYEKGANRISCGTLARLADLYKLPVAWFFQGAVVERSAEQDVGTQLIATPHGAELARRFLDIDDPKTRSILIDVAAALCSARSA